MHKRLIASAAAAVALTLLGGCFNSDDEDTPQAATDEVPASASASTAGLFSYLMLLIASNADDREPVDISTVTPPGSDSDEPTPLT